MDGHILLYIAVYITFEKAHHVTHNKQCSRQAKEIRIKHFYFNDKIIRNNTTTTRTMSQKTTRTAIII